MTEQVDNNFAMAKYFFFTFIRFETFYRMQWVEPWQYDNLHRKTMQELRQDKKRVFSKYV